MLMLGVECTASPVSCAVFEDGTLKAEYYLDTKVTHSQTLMPMIESVLSISGHKIGEVDAFAVAVGPGSFTGVRIGVSAVKGLTAANNKPCIPVSVLCSMAYGLTMVDGIICAVMDARCNQFYNALFRIENGVVTRLCDDRALMADELIADVLRVHSECPKSKVFIVGDGADLFYGKIAPQADFVQLAPANLKRQRAAGVCMAAEISLLNGKTVTSEELLPLYLRLPQAERELKKKNESKDKQ